jgi:hypothetical protein
LAVATIARMDVLAALGIAIGYPALVAAALIIIASLTGGPGDE